MLSRKECEERANVNTLIFLVYEETEPSHSCLGMSGRYGRSVFVVGFCTGAEGLYPRRRTTLGCRNRDSQTYACQNFVGNLRTGIPQGRLEKSGIAKHGRCSKTLCRYQCARLRRHRWFEDRIGAKPRCGTYCGKLRRCGYQQYTSRTNRRGTILARQCFDSLTCHRTR